MKTPIKQNTPQSFNLNKMQEGVTGVCNHLNLFYNPSSSKYILNIDHHLVRYYCTCIFSLSYRSDFIVKFWHRHCYIKARLKGRLFSSRARQSLCDI